MSSRLQLIRPACLSGAPLSLAGFSQFGNSFRKFAPLTPVFATLTKTTGVVSAFLFKNLFLALAFGQFVNVLFSYSCKTPTPQLLSFDIHAKHPGGGVYNP
jgi:hypothetical protein